MAIRPIVHHGDPVLRKKCRFVEEITPQVRRLIDDMFDTMYHAPGVGLAANQIGIDLSIAVIDVQQEGRKTPIVLINPKIVELGGELFEEEGCLSIPGFTARVKRAGFAKVSALNEKGFPMIYTGEGLLARALQHETDHLNGKFYVDHLPWLARTRLLANFRKVQKKKK